MEFLNKEICEKLTASNCKFWINNQNLWKYEDLRFDRDADYEIIHSNEYVRECKHPKLVFYERPY